MFKKLKQKIEEGEEGAIDRLSFSPRRLPGSAVRSTPAPSEPPGSGEEPPAAAEARHSEEPNNTELVDGFDSGVSGDGATDFVRYQYSILDTSDRTPFLPPQEPSARA